MAKTLFTFFLFIYFSNPAFTQTQQFIYSAFKHSNITLNGVAQVQPNGILQLTNYTPRSIGHAFHPYSIHLKNSTSGKSFSFSTAFVFAVVPEYEKLGGHGLAFTISANNDIASSLPSQYLGLLNASSNGNFYNHVFAVEFDTVQDFEFGDINDNHVGIDINSLVSNDSVPAGYFVEGNSSKQALKLKSGKRIQAWIDYDSTKNEVNVSLSLSSKRPSSSILSFQVDLSLVFNEYMYVGFSASTGLLASQHYLFGWSFSVNGEAESLDLSSLPSLPGFHKNHTPLIVGVLVSVLVVIVVISATIYYLVRRMNMDVIEDWEFDTGPHRFSYKELRKATKGFRDKELLGFGGFGKVYKGILPDSRIEVAVKRISHESKQGLREFVSEIASIGRLRHRNLVQLLGWCRRRGDLLIVYEFMANGSLDKYIYENPRLILNWEQRMKIIKGAALGLLYLHEEWEQIVIHRDIKAGNVLLDSEFNGRLGDFGLAKLYEHGSNPSTTRVVGTLGYLAPELTRTGKPTTSSDVFAFGALILEVVCGRRPVEAKAVPEELILVDWVWEMWKDGAVMRVVDRRLEGQFDENELVLAVKLGLMCSNDNLGARPSMRQVVRYLDGEVRLPEVVDPPGGGGDSGGFEDFVHSYPSSSAGGANDVEGGPDASLLFSGE